MVEERRRREVEEELEGVGGVFGSDKANLPMFRLSVAGITGGLFQSTRKWRYLKQSCVGKSCECEE
jgi:hypothetical protein